MKNYIRTIEYTFEELSARHQLAALDQLSSEDARLTNWIKDPTDLNNVLPLCNFEALPGNKIWNGFFGLSYFSGYFVKIGRDGQILVAYRHW